MSKMKKRSNYRTIEVYEVKNITIETDAEIIDFCAKYNYGGRVYRHGNTATVEVYID